MSPVLKWLRWGRLLPSDPLLLDIWAWISSLETSVHKPEVSQSIWAAITKITTDWGAYRQKSISILEAEKS